MMQTDTAAATTELSKSHLSCHTGEGLYPCLGDFDCPAPGDDPGLRQGGEMEELH